MSLIYNFDFAVRVFLNYSLYILGLIQNPGLLLLNAMCLYDWITEMGPSDFLVLSFPLLLSQCLTGTLKEHSCVIDDVGGHGSRKTITHPYPW